MLAADSAGSPFYLYTRTHSWSDSWQQKTQLAEARNVCLKSDELRLISETWAFIEIHLFVFLDFCGWVLFFLYIYFYKKFLKLSIVLTWIKMSVLIWGDFFWCLLKHKTKKKWAVLEWVRSDQISRVMKSFKIKVFLLGMNIITSVDPTTFHVMRLIDLLWGI